MSVKKINFYVIIILNENNTYLKTNNIFGDFFDNNYSQNYNSISAFDLRNKTYGQKANR